MPAAKPIRSASPSHTPHDTQAHIHGGEEGLPQLLLLRVVGLGVPVPALAPAPAALLLVGAAQLGAVLQRLRGVTSGRKKRSRLKGK